MKTPFTFVVVAALAVPACGGSGGFDDEAARDLLNERVPGMSTAAREDAISAMEEGCEGDDVVGGVRQMATSDDVPAVVFDALLAACPAAADAFEDMDVGEMIAQSDACEAAFRTIDVAIQAWYASAEEGNPSSLDDLIGAGFVADNDMLNGLVEVAAGEPSKAQAGSDC